MKKSIYILLLPTLMIRTIFILFMAAGLFVSSQTTLRAQGIKIGYTRLEYILAQTPEAKSANNQMAAQQAQAEGELKRMKKELDDKYAVYQKTGAQLSDLIRKDREAELQSLQARIQEFAKKAEESMQNKYKQLITPVLSKVQQTIDLVAKENGYTHVLNAGTGNSTDILFASEENNITDLVLKKLGITPGQNLEVPAKSPAPTTPAKPTAPVKSATPKKK